MIHWQGEAMQKLASEPTAEAIVWNSAKRTKPDADITVLLFAPSADEPVWPGYYDGKFWCWADGTSASGVIAFAEMPRGLRGTVR